MCSKKDIMVVAFIVGHNKHTYLPKILVKTILGYFLVWLHTDAEASIYIIITKCNIVNKYQIRYSNTKTNFMKIKLGLKNQLCPIYDSSDLHILASHKTILN